jgi:uncharacterized protein YdiU (UPF0061 family)
MSALWLMVLSFSVVQSMQHRRHIQEVLRTSYHKMSMAARPLNAIAVSENSFQKYLKGEEASLASLTDGGSIYPHQVTGVHYSAVLPEKVKSPYLVSKSNSCLESLAISLQDSESEDFLQYFAGNKLLPGMDIPYTTVYGTHSAGTWFGQMGDGRAIYLGETHVGNSEQLREQQFYSLGLRELQLKGCGRSPFSRGFDGRAVLRSSVREFLVSEAMHHLRVPTTRALTVVGTNQAVRRPWYASTSQSNPYRVSRKFPPDTMVVEPGAIVCRVSRSFLRFGHLEIFGHREEYPQLLQMADYMCLREYPHLLEISSDKCPAASLPVDRLPDSLSPGPARRYIELFRCITNRVAYLVAQWMRVGYVQGNMNSDNTLIAGRTMDYGPFGWMETFDPNYQPFTSDVYGNFCFIRQPAAMGLNVETLRDSAIEPLLKYICAQQNDDANLSSYYDEVRRIAEEEFETFFSLHWREVQRQKLGFSSFDDPAGNESLWTKLMETMTRYPCDYIIFFRELSKVDATIHDASAALNIVAPAFSTPNISGASCSATPAAGGATKTIDEVAWAAWFTLYLQRLREEKVYDAKTRREVMNQANPKFVLRNWMGAMAYEKAEDGDFSVIEELQTLFRDPYSEHSAEMTQKWYTGTPLWAESLPGVAFFSCSS